MVCRAFVESEGCFQWEVEEWANCAWVRRGMDGGCYDVDPSSEPGEWPKWIVEDMLAVESLTGYCRMVWAADWG